MTMAMRRSTGSSSTRTKVRVNPGSNSVFFIRPRRGVSGGRRVHGEASVLLGTGLGHFRVFVALSPSFVPLRSRNPSH